MIKFGTDGIRGVYDKDLFKEDAYKIGRALCKIKPYVNVVIGKDTRISGSILEKYFIQGIIDGGGKVVRIGIVPTPCVAYVTKTFNFDYGVMITASHNSKEYNGIKIFNNRAEKIEREVEEKIEKLILDINISARIKKLPKINYNLSRKYVEFVLCNLKQSDKKLKIVIDCSNGANYTIAKKVFSKTNFQVSFINNKRKGNLINENCGALYTKQLQQEVLKEKADVGFAFDGDADRLVVVDETGKEVDGNKMLFLFSKILQNDGLLRNNIMVSTVYMNTKIIKMLEDIGIKATMVDVGDKYIIRELIDKNLSFGGEASGHYIFKDMLETGDGLLSSIFVCNILQSETENLSKLNNYELFSMITESVIINKLKNEEVKREFLKECENIINDTNNQVRINIRNSGTEPKIRIMCESPQQEVTQYYINIIKNIVLKYETNEN